MKTIKKTVRDTAAGKSISAWVILNPDKKHIATVQAHFGQVNTGVRIMLDVWGVGEIIMQASGNNTEVAELMHGCIIGGIKLYGQGKSDSASNNLLNRYKSGELNLEHAKTLVLCNGMRFANWNSEKNQYTSILYMTWIDMLENFGFTVIQAI